MPKILIVDDEWLTRVEIEELLNDLGYEVSGQAETGAEAIAMAHELNPDLILMDVEMPGGMNGIDAARIIKAELGIPIVFISGYGDPEYIEAAKEIAPFGYVMKPFDAQEIHAFVEIALSKRELELKLEKAHESLEQTNLDLQKEIAAGKKTAKALRKSEKKYRSLIANIPDVTWTADSQGKTIFISPNCEKIFGYTPKEVYEGGNDIFPGRIHPGDAEKAREAFKRLFEKGTMFDVEYRIQRKDGQWIWAHDRSIEVYARDGLRYADGIFSDITERKNAEAELKYAHDELEQLVESRTAELAKANKLLEDENEARKRSEEDLRKSEEHLNSLMESASNFVVYRLVGDSDNPNLLRVIFVSPSIKDIMGVSEPMNFEKWFEHVHPDDVQRIIRANAEAFKTLRFDETMRVYHPLKQKWVWIHAVSTGFEDPEQKNYVNGIMVDVTKQREGRGPI